MDCRSLFTGKNKKSIISLFPGRVAKVNICVFLYFLGSIQEQSVLGDIARKDSLSLKVEFINLNISRSRKLEIRSEGLLDKLDPVKSNIVRFSGMT